MREIRFEDEEPGERSLEEGLRFARRMYPARVFGLAMGAILIGGSLWAAGAGPFAWALMLLNTLAWPHLAYPLVRRARNPHRQELLNLMIDSASGGVWMAVMHFSPAPSVILFTMLAMDKAAVGGLRFMLRCIGAQAFAAAVVTVLVGWETPVAETSYWARVACLPLLVFYPMAVGYSAYKLSRRVRQQAQALAALSSTDELSHLLNQAHWKRAALAEFHRCRRLGNPASLMMIDIDRFKEVNDRYGHPAGDAVIRAAAAIVRDNVRAHDVPGRYGGDEFAVLLPGADENTAHIIAERIRTRIADTVLDAANGVRSTVSIGVAEHRPEDPNAEAWLARADRALYRAKQAGRDRSELDRAA